MIITTLQEGELITYSESEFQEVTVLLMNELAGRFNQKCSFFFFLEKLLCISSGRPMRGHCKTVLALSYTYIVQYLLDLDHVSTLSFIFWWW